MRADVSRGTAGGGRAGGGRHARKRRPVTTIVTVAGVLTVTIGATGAMWVAQHGPRWMPAAAARSGTGLAGKLRAGLPARAQYLRARTAARRAALDRQLQAELGELLGRHAGDLAVGVADRTTGAIAMYHAGQQFYTASIVKADILAALLLQAQRHRAAAQLPAEESAQAKLMIEDSNNDAATDLWARAGGAAGIASADLRLGLQHTVPDPAGAWGLTSTTVADQLRLLADLTTRESPLAAGSRAYELGLMRSVAPSEAWGVPAAASPGSAPAVKDGWLAFPDLWIVNSIGVVRQGGQLLCVVVLSDGQPTEAAGIRQVAAAAVTAVRLVTGRPPARAAQVPALSGTRSAGQAG